MSPLPKVFCRPEQLQQPPKTLRPEEETGCFICCHGYTDTKPVCHCVVCSSNSIGTSTPTCFCHWQLKIIKNWASSITRNFEHCEYIHSPRIQSHFRMADSSPKCHWKKKYFANQSYCNSQSKLFSLKKKQAASSDTTAMLTPKLTATAMSAAV